MWIKPDELVEVDVAGKIIKFKPVKRGERIKAQELFINTDIDDRTMIIEKTAFDFVLSHIVSIAGVDDVNEFLQFQSPDMIGNLLSTIMKYGTIENIAIENLDLPSALPLRDIQTETVTNADKGDASQKAQLKQNEKAKLN